MRLDLSQLDAALDLWLCMWEPDEQASFETALVRSLTDRHGRSCRLCALAACQAIGTPRLLAAAVSAEGTGDFSDEEMSCAEEVAVQRRKLLRRALRLRGNLFDVELLLERQAAGLAEDALLDFIDLRDLVAVARTTLDPQMFAEVVSCIQRRGKYQRGRAANVLGFRLLHRDQPSGEYDQVVVMSP